MDKRLKRFNTAEFSLKGSGKKVIPSFIFPDNDRSADFEQESESNPLLKKNGWKWLKLAVNTVFWELPLSITAIAYL